MDTVSLLLSLGLLLLVAAYVARPLLDPAARTEPHVSGQAELEARREAVLTALRDLDFDHRTGKVSDEDHAAQRAALVAEGVALLKHIDELAQTPAAPDTDLSEDDALEAAIRAARARLPRAKTPPGGADAPPALACPSCGKAARPEDRFCGRCGTALGERVA